jgi:hypothetical protein
MSVENGNRTMARKRTVLAAIKLIDNYVRAKASFLRVLIK